MAQLSPYQRDVLIRTALGEARGEGAEGMADVIQVILNRAASGEYPSDPAAVALQPKQFSTWNRGEGGNNPQQFKPSDRIYQTAEQALDAVLSGSRPDPTGGALFYHTPAVNPNWAKEANRFGTIERNGHVFYPSRPVPPGEIPNVVASQLDTTRPQNITGNNERPTSALSRAFPTMNATPRLAPAQDGIYAYTAQDMERAHVAPGLGSVTDEFFNRAVPMSRLDPRQPNRMDIAASQAPITGFPTPLPSFQPGPPRRLPELPPPVGRPDIVTASMARANAAIDPGLQRAIDQRIAPPGLIDTSMQRAASAVDPALQRALAMQNAPRTSLASIPLPPTAIPGPTPTPKGQERLAAGLYPMTPRMPEAGVASALSVVPPMGMPPLPRPRPQRVANVSMPTPVAMRPAMTPPPVAYRQAVGAPPPLRVVVDGANLIMPRPRPRPVLPSGNTYQSDLNAGPGSSGFGG